MIERPEDRLPFFVDRRGEESPLFVPPAILELARRTYPRLWIEPTPMLKP